MSDVPYNRGAGRLKRIGGIVMGVLTAIMLIGAVQDVDLTGVVIVGAFGLGSWLMLRSAAKDAELARQAALAQLQLRVLELAREDGRLTTTEVATRLGWTLQQAGAVLASLDDGMRVSSMPSDEGVMVYEFRELLHDPDGARVQAPAQRPLPEELQLLADPPPLPVPRSARGQGA